MFLVLASCNFVKVSRVWLVVDSSALGGMSPAEGFGLGVGFSAAEAGDSRASASHSAWSLRASSSSVSCPSNLSSVFEGSSPFGGRSELPLPFCLCLEKKYSRPLEGTAICFAPELSLRFFAGLAMLWDWKMESRHVGVYASIRRAKQNAGCRMQNAEMLVRRNWC